MRRLTLISLTLTLSLYVTLLSANAAPLAQEDNDVPGGEILQAGAAAIMAAHQAMAQPQNGDADVLFVAATQSNDGTWRFNVTVEHLDTGWEDYADGWDVVLPDGEVVKRNPDDPFTRLLLHPHENEQPFTRSQSGLVIPSDVTQVSVRAHDLVDGFGGREVIVDLTQAEGEDFTVVGAE